jgi:ketosteroid isomerase-like protein
MSQQNVERFRASFERFNKDGWLPPDLFAADIELANFQESPIPGPYNGHEGLRRWREDLFEVVEEARFEIDELTDADEAGAVVARVRITGRARFTGIAIEAPFSITAWFREGLIHRSVGYRNHADALEAAGVGG